MKKLTLALAAILALGITTTASADMPKAAKKCIACHTFEKGDTKKKMGPNLFGIAGAPAGQVAGFKYAADFTAKMAGKTWDDATLDAWLSDPKKMVAKTKMMVKITKAEDRQAIIDYLKTLK